jgi:hypothetical protein
MFHPLAKKSAALNSPHPALTRRIANRSKEEIVGVESFDFADNLQTRPRRTANRSKAEIVGVASFESADNLQTRPPMRGETTAPRAPSLSPPISPRRQTRPSSFQLFSISAFQRLPSAMPACGCASSSKLAIAHTAFSFLVPA